MKKFFLGLVCSNFLFANLHATTHIIEVSNYQFSPSSVNAVVGDVITWNWKSGFHTTTSTSVPAGAATWDAPMTSSKKTFSYTITVEGSYNFYCKYHPDMLGGLTVSSTVPVKLSSFNISTGTAKNSVQINWATASELNTSYFAVKKSTDGKTFTEIGRVQAKGNSTTLQQYSFTDVNPGPENRFLYYSLEMADKDGKKENSEIKLYKNNIAIKKIITKISPNPVTQPGHLIIQFNSDKSIKMDVKIFDAAGKLVKRFDMQAETGLNNGHIHMGDYKAGAYNLVFTLDGIKETHKIVVQ